MASYLTIPEVQAQLCGLGLYAGRLDGIFGPKSRAAFLAAMTGSPGRLTETDLAEAAKRLAVEPAQLGAVCDVESSGIGIDRTSRRPIIRYEGHKFRTFTSARFDAVRPDLSYAYGDRSKHPQPAAQAGRWDLLCDAVELAPGEALCSASYGFPQIMGYHYSAAGYPDVWSFALSMASSERVQLRAFCQFLKSEGLVAPLQRGDWAAFAAGYNGPGYADAPGRANDYDTKLAAAYRARGGR